MRSALRALAVVTTLAACSACTPGSPSTFSSSSASREPASGLQAAAISWSNAFLTGTVAEIRGMEGTQCSSETPHFSPTFLAGYLKAIRESMERYIGVPLERIRVTGVLTRDVTSTQGEAQVQYDLPSSRVGNDNWVTYQVQEGRWKESSCQAPIGGQSSSASASDSAS